MWTARVALAISIVNSFVLATAEPRAALPPVHDHPSAVDSRVRVILKQAMDTALTEYAAGQFSVWMRDPTGQPQRAVVGLKRAIEAYRHADNAIDRDFPAQPPPPP
jgi:hypothetical protein